jgi:hypothetical protein
MSPSGPFLRRLALYRPYGDRKIEAACREFVLAAVHENEGGITSCKECQEVIHKLWGLELELHEVARMIRRLVRQGKLVEQSGQRLLSDECGKALTNRVRLSREVETAAFEEWEHSVSRMAPALGTQQLAELQGDLGVWLQQIIIDYGVESSILLNVEHERHARYIEEVKALSVNLLPARDARVMMIRADALVMFFEETTSMQSQYFENLLATAYLMSVFTLDPAVLSRVWRLTNGQRLYLDTNLVYKLLKLNGPEEYLAIRRVLDLSFRLGYQVCVTPWTLMEMQESVRRARLRLARKGPSPQNLASLTADSTTDELFIKAFRRMQRETGLTLDHFFDLHEELEQLLKDADIDVVTEGCRAIDDDEDLDRLEDLIAALERGREGDEKPRPVQEHDVKLRLLVESLRGPNPRRFSDVGYIVLTNDQALTRFAEADLDHTTELPFAVSLHRWSRIVRSLVPRTADYENTLAHIQGTPALRPPSLRVNQADVIEAIAKIDAQGKYPETIAMRLMVDMALGSDAETAIRDADSAASDSRVKDAEFARRIAELQTRVRELQRQEVARQREHSAQLEAHIDKEKTARAEARAARRKLIELQRQLDAARKREQAGPAASEAHDAPPPADSAIVELANLKQRVARNETNVRWLVGIMIAIAGGAAIGVPCATGLITGGWLLVGDICAGGGMLLGAFAWVYGQKKAAILATSVAFLLTTAVTLRSILNESSAPPATPSIHAHASGQPGEKRRSQDQRQVAHARKAPRAKTTGG